MDDSNLKDKLKYYTGPPIYGEAYHCGGCVDIDDFMQQDETTWSVTEQSVFETRIVVTY